MAKKKTVARSPGHISAQVVLRSKSGKAIRGAAITSQNLGEYVPSPESVDVARSAFASAGFEVSPLVGISFTIEAPLETFEQVFKARVRPVEKGGLLAVVEGREAGPELPLEALPGDVVSAIEAVTFARPIDFGPMPSGFQ